MTELEIIGDIGLIWLDNPPVNAISSVMAQGLIRAIKDANARSDLKSLVLICRGRTFVAGADIKEFDAGNRPEGGFPDTRGAMERSRLPIIAALHGTALGGGFELALCCDWRIALPGTKFGLPEVTLGVLPGGGGTQLLPRIVGIEPALEIMLSGRMVGVEEGLRLGAIDRIVEGDLAAEALRFAAGLPEGRRRLRDLALEAPGERGFFDARRKAAARSHRGQTAPQRIIDCVEEATRAPYKTAVAAEFARFLECLEDPQAAALQHAFFAHRQISRIPGLAPEISPAEIRSVAVIGGGTMGSGIAISVLAAGLSVRLLENDQEALDRGTARITTELDALAARGRISPQEAARRRAALTPTLSFGDLADVDLAIEAVFEAMAVKHDVFRKLDAVLKPGAILASNTSALSIDEIAGATSRPQDVVGLHFFSPANIMKLCEVVRGETATSAQTLATAVGFAKQIRKTPVVAGNCYGFIGNRMVFGYLHQAELLLLEGATPQQIDRALTDFGMAMGPLQMCDLAGLDVAWRARKADPDTRRDPRAHALQDRLCEAGRFGQKTGAGYYDYAEGGRKAERSVLVEDWLRELSAAFGYQRREISDAEIVERCILALFNIGCDILDEGHAWRAGDIDVVYLDGYGFPAYRGGPMFWAEHSFGLTEAAAALQRHQELTGAEWMRVSPALLRMVAEGRGLKALEQ